MKYFLKVFLLQKCFQEASQAGFFVSNVVFMHDGMQFHFTDHL